MQQLLLTLRSSFNCIRRSSSAALIVLAVTIQVAPRRVAAQQTAISDTVTGQVFAQDSTPIPSAQVRIKGDDGRERNTVTDSAGRYMLTMPNGTGIYELRARAFGYSAFSVIVERTGGAMHIQRDLRLNPHPYAIPTVRVVASDKVKVDRVTPAEKLSRWQAFMTQDLPVEPGNLGDVAAIQPGVVRSGSGLSIAGQGPDQNKTTVDGASYNGADLPAEGVASTGVVTSSYDVARGQFSGGQIIASTISGTNLWGGAFHVRLDDPALSYGALPGSLASDQRNVRLSTGAGGPLVRDKLFAYAAVDLGRARAPVSSLDLLDPASLFRLGLSSDSVRRLLDIVQRLGAYSPPERALTESGTDHGSMLARFDYAISDHQSLTARIDWRGSNFAGLGASPFSLPQGDDELRRRDGGALLQLASGWGLWGNELRIYRANGSTHTDAGLEVPHAEVQLASTRAGDANSASSIGFGGVPFRLGGEHSLTELSDQLVRETESGVHRVDAGFVLQKQTATVAASGNRFGSFTFNSLSDLDAGRPALFTRSLARQPESAASEYAAAYVGDIWRPNPDFSLIYGIRLDGNSYGSRPAPSAAVTALAPDARTQVPSELLMTPRLGFSYTPVKSEWHFDGGVGAFDGTNSVSSLASLWDDTGIGDLSLTCVGPAAPKPAWSDYRADASAIPSTCADGAPNFSGSTPSAILFDQHFGTPRTWRASFGADRSLGGLWGVSLNAMVVHGTHLPTAEDRNFVPQVNFVLPDEMGRPVYASPVQIDAATGGIAPDASRKDAALGSVRELGSFGQSWTEQIIAETNGSFHGILFDFDYAFTRSRVRGGAIPALGGSEGTTAGDPGGLEWMDGAFTPRHTFQGMLNYRFGRRSSLGVIGRLASGLPFTPLVSQDINGDGFGNDRAFVFDPLNTPDPTVAQGMAGLLGDASASVGECLRNQAGQIAQPGSCHTQWIPSLDLLANIVVGKVAARRFTLSFFASNITAGLDYLIHGPDRLHGWGQYSYPDATLLEVRGFDPEKRAYKYAVNPRFGQPVGGGLSRLPFRITLQGRFTIGADPRYQPLMAAVRAGMGSANASAREDVARQIRNVPAIVLQLVKADSGAPPIALAQQARLQAVADSLAPKISIATDSLTAALLERGPMTAGRNARMQKWTEGARALVEVAVLRTREVLTADQWEKLPAWLIKPADPQRLRMIQMHGTATILVP